MQISANRWYPNLFTSSTVRLLERFMTSSKAGITQYWSLSCMEPMRIFQTGSRCMSFGIDRCYQVFRDVIKRIAVGYIERIEYFFLFAFLELLMDYLLFVRAMIWCIIVVLIDRIVLQVLKLNILVAINHNQWIPMAWLLYQLTHNKGTLGALQIRSMWWTGGKLVFHLYLRHSPGHRRVVGSRKKWRQR